MEGEERSHEFKLQRSRSCLYGLTGGRKSSSLLQDSLSPHNGDSVPLPRYVRLSQSMRVFSEEPRQEERERWLQKRGWVGKVMGHLLFLRKLDTRKGKERKKKKKRSSWLPDPERRWPVQGCNWGSAAEESLFEVLMPIQY